MVVLFLFILLIAVVIYFACIRNTKKLSNDALSNLTTNSLVIDSSVNSTDKLPISKSDSVDNLKVRDDNIAMIA